MKGQIPCPHNATDEEAAATAVSRGDATDEEAVATAGLGEDSTEEEVA